MTKILIMHRKHLEIYELATEERFSFLFVNLMESDINKVFMIRYDKRIMIDDKV